MRKNEFIPYMKISLIKNETPVTAKERIMRIFEKLLFDIAVFLDILNPCVVKDTLLTSM